jgi:hypothetical protein
MSANQRPVTDLHFDCAPLQIGDAIMVRLQVADNFGITFQLVLPPDAAFGLGQYLQGQSLIAKRTLVKPPSMLAEN